MSERTDVKVRSHFAMSLLTEAVARGPDDGRVMDN